MIFNVMSTGSVFMGDIITVSENEPFPIPIGIAMNSAKKGETVSISLCGSMVIPEDKEETKIKIETYEVPTINMEVPKIELD